MFVWVVEMAEPYTPFHTFSIHDVSDDAHASVREIFRQNRYANARVLRWDTRTQERDEEYADYGDWD